MAGLGARSALYHDEILQKSPVHRMNSRDQKSLQRNLHSDITEMLKEEALKLNEEHFTIKKIENKLFNIRTEESDK